ncbi:flavodoxin [Bacillus kexueae]|uniref:flavodoxin n=1 Tax=Aeribacillus kexueae TaxID=2078952 RepID=UPI001FAF5F30|nr:flavodoxin [Bacillus kexueae]
MKKILLIYTSMSGNTESIAQEIVNGIKRTGEEVEVLELFEVESLSLLSEYDGILLGAYTWGDGELPDEFIGFYEELNDLDLRGKVCATFGSGDTMYPQFCAAVDLLEMKLRDRGATIVQQGLKIEFSPEGEEIEVCRMFGEQFAQKMQLVSI